MPTSVEDAGTVQVLAFRPRRLAALCLRMQHDHVGFSVPAGFGGHGVAAIRGAADRARREAGYWRQWPASRSAAALAADYLLAAGLLEERAARAVGSAAVG